MLQGIPHTPPQGAGTGRMAGGQDFQPKRGETFRGTVVERRDNGNVLILARGTKFQALAARPLTEGRKYLFQVRAAGERLLLKVVEGDASGRTSAVRLWASGRAGRAKLGRILGELAGSARDDRLSRAVRDTLVRLGNRIPAAVYRGPQPDGARWLVRQLRESGLFLEGRAARFLLEGDGAGLRSLETADIKGLLLFLKASLGSPAGDTLAADLIRQVEQGLQIIQQDQMLNLSALKDGLGWFWFIPGNPEEGFRRGEVFVQRPEQEGEETFLSLSLDFSILGHLDAAVSMKRPALSLRILTEEAGVAEFLGSHLEELRDSLAAAGLEPGTITCRERRKDDPEWTPFTEAADLTGAVDVLA